MKSTGYRALNVAGVAVTLQDAQVSKASFVNRTQQCYAVKNEVIFLALPSTHLWFRVVHVNHVTVRCQAATGQLSQLTAACGFAPMLCDGRLIG